MRTFPFPQEWRGVTISKCQEHMGVHMKSSQTSALDVCSSLVVFGLQRVLTGFSLVNSTVPWPDFIRHCQMVVFQERYSGCLGNGNYHVLTNLLHSITQHHIVDLGSVDQNSSSVISRAFKNAQQSWETFQKSLFFYLSSKFLPRERDKTDKTAEQ